MKTHSPPPKSPAVVATEEDKPVIWSIGGSDTRAGAGIQADLLTASDLGACCNTIISAVTAQSRRRVNLIAPVSDDIFLQQLHSATEDGLPKIIKIGLLATQSQVNIIRDWLADKTVKLICDPVQVASTGDALICEPVDLTPLLPFCILITPNQEEFAQFNSQLPPNNKVTNVLLTGLRTSATTIVDQLTSMDSELQIHWEHEIIETNNTHGTGCTLSTAIAVGLAQALPLEDAITLAIAYVQQGLFNNGKITPNLSVAHNGWPMEEKLWPIAYPVNPLDLATAVTINKQQLHFPPLKQPLGFYPVVDSANLVKQLIEQGVKTLQLRIKTASNTPGLREEIAEAIEYADQHDAQLFINDHWQLACELHAYGVHLGQEDITQANLRAVFTAGLRLGISTHGFYELAYARAFHPSYIALGHIFATPTKQMPSQPQGLTKLKWYAKLCSDIPSVAIGGINEQNAEKVLRCGVDAIAVVRAVTQSTNLQNTVNIFKNIFEHVQVPHNIEQRTANEALCE